MRRFISRHRRGFGRAQDGFVLFLTALIILPVLAIFGLCFDAGQGFRSRELLSHATRAGALLAARRLGDDPEAAAAQMVVLHVPSATVSATVDAPNQTVALETGRTTLPVIMRLFGNDAFRVAGGARARPSTGDPPSPQLF